MRDNKKAMKRLPDAEFAVMKVVWACEPPITASMIMEQLGEKKNWKMQTVVSLLLRLVERGFLCTENSFFSLVNTLYDDKNLTEKDIDELIRWAKERRG